MPNITFFTEVNERDNEDLPWAKDWLKSVNDAQEPREIFTIYSGDKGLLILTGEYKHFIFKKQSVVKHLVEALGIWVDEQNPVSPIVCCCLNKKVHVGINNDAKKVFWHRDEDKFYSVPADDSPSLKLKNPANPFLSPTTPPEEKPARTKSGTKG